jgi:hypothetical protein
MTAADDADRQWAHTLLARAMDDEPELQLRAEEVLTSGRRSLGRRRAALTGAITVVALAATGILLSLADSARSGAQTAHQGQPALSTTAPAAPETTLYGAEGPLILDAHSRVMTPANRPSSGWWNWCTPTGPRWTRDRATGAWTATRPSAASTTRPVPNHR